MGALSLGKRLRGHRAHGLRPLVANYAPLTARPALQGAHVDAWYFAGRPKTRVGGMCHRDIPGKGLSIFEVDQMPYPLLKNAATVL
jgi:hypothetical protein